MKMHSEKEPDWENQREKIIGLGESSIRKSYYPELQKKHAELLKKNEELEAAYEELTATDEELRIQYEEISNKEQELRESEEKYRELADSITDIFFAMDLDLRYTYWNNASEELTGIPAQDAIGKTSDEIFSDTPDILRDVEVYRDVIRTHQPRSFVIEHYLGERHRFFEINAYPSAGGIAVFIRDITGRKEAETELARVNRALRMLIDSNRALVHITDETMLMNEICRIVVNVGGYRMAWIGFAEQDEAKTVRPVAQAGFESGYLESANISWADTERGRGPVGIAIRTGQPSMARNISMDPAFALWRADAMLRGYQSMIALPLTNEDRTFGALGIYAGEADAFDTEEVEILKELGGNLAFGITALRTRITRDQVEEALKDSYAILKGVVESPRDVVIFALDRQYRYIAFNENHRRTMKRIWGVDIALGISMPEYIRNPEDCKKAVINFDRALSGESFTVYEKYGDTVLERRWYEDFYNPIMDEDDNVIGLTLFLTDISGRRQMEDALRQSEKKFRDIVEASPEIIWEIDAEGSFTYVSPKCSGTLGYEPKDLIGKTIFFLIPPEHIPTIQAAFSEHDYKKGAIFTFDVIACHREGHRITIEIRSTPVMDSSGTLTGFRGIALDVTELRRAEEALQQARSKLNLLNIVTFQDIQTAAFTMSAYQELIRKNLTDPKAKSYLKKENTSLQIIIDSLNFAKNYQEMGIHHPSWHNVHQVFLFAISHLDFLHIKRNISLDGLEIYADSLLEKVFVNLMENVLRHGIRATEVTIRYRENPDGLELIIEDNGVGIPPEEKHMIFDRGYGKNTGLGLFLVREVLSITGMTIKETGVPGKGARFEIAVPKGGYRFTDTP